MNSSYRRRVREVEFKRTLEDVFVIAQESNVSVRAAAFHRRAGGWPAVAHGRDARATDHFALLLICLIASRKPLRRHMTPAPLINFCSPLTPNIADFDGRMTDEDSA